MDDMKAAAAKHHEDAARHFEVAAKMHRDAARHYASGNHEKAESLATSAVEAEGVANRHAMQARDSQAVDSYRRHAQEVADRKAEAEAEGAARAAKHEAKAAAKQ